MNETGINPLTSDDYKPLHTLLPLKTPLSVTFCSTQNCNFFCEFCYRYGIDKTQLSKERMSLSFLEKCAADIAEFDDKINVVDVCGSGEPLLLPYLSEWISLLKQTNNIKQIKMITNGTLLTPTKAEQVISAGLDLIVFSINGLSDEGNRKVVHANVDFNKLVDNIKYAFSIRGKCKIHIKCIGDYFSKEDQKKFLEIFSPYADSIHIDSAINQWIDVDLPPTPFEHETSENRNRFGKDFQFKNKPMCNFPFYYLRVHTSGKVSSCATNWKDDMIIGDANSSSLKEIWNGKELNDLRIKILKQKNPSQCESCHYYEMMTGEDLTQYKESLLGKYLDLNGGNT